jgi:hypothetical protein
VLAVAGDADGLRGALDAQVRNVLEPAAQL